MENSLGTIIGPLELSTKLKLSGSVLNASFCIPYDVSFKENKTEWDIKLRRGNSALYKSISCLASCSSGWNHTFVGWTGEIASINKRGSSEVWDEASANKAPVNISSTPVAVADRYRTSLSAQHAVVRVSQRARQKLESQLERQYGSKLCPIWLPCEMDKDEDIAIFKNQARWRKFAEEELYALFHYQHYEPTNGLKAQNAWEDYSLMNNAFADRLLEIYRPGDIIIVHDFYLFLLPSLLRRRLPNAYIGFYLHTPFPSSEIYRCLGRRKEILEGMLGANMIGFQTFSYSRHFSSCCTRILGHDSSSAGIDIFGGHISTEVIPMGIDTIAMHKFIGFPGIMDTVSRLRDLYAGKKIIIGRDRLEPSQGVAQKLQAFELFLARYPHWREKVVLIQVTSPNHRFAGERDQDNRTANQITELVSRINGSFGSLSFAPVQYFPQTFAPEEYYALLHVADVGLITSVRDGINTTGLEYVICQNGNYGPLIISEFSGTSGNLGSAIHINPWDIGGVADAINRALGFSQEERVRRYNKLYQNVITLDVRSWTNNFLKRLITNLCSVDSSVITPQLDRGKMLSQFRKASKRLFLFDYDGTLTPIVNNPGAATPSDRVIRTIKALVADNRNAVWIISGRDQAFLDEWVGNINALGLSAEHGSFIRYPGAKTWENLAEKMDKSWQNEVLNVFQTYTESTQGSFIERKKIALTWHYRCSDPAYAARQARECQKTLEYTVAKKWPVEIMAGKANIEVRPSLVNKGEIAKRLIRLYSDRTQPLEFVLCMGDDYTDEDMFRAIKLSEIPSNYIFLVVVGAGSKQTLANWHLPEPSDVILTITILNEVLNVKSKEIS